MSIGKLLVLALIILVVWYGFKYASRVEAARRNRQAEAQRGRGNGNIGGGMRTAAKPVEDLVKCQRCGAFVAAEGTANCGKPGCPWGA